MALDAAALTRAEFRALARFRLELRRFLNFSEAAARRAGLEPQQHQLLLAIAGLPDPEDPPTTGNLATWLHVRHHSAVELVDRAAARGLVRRELDPRDRRRVLLEITAAGEVLLQELSHLHRAELQTAAPALLDALHAVLSSTSSSELAMP
jgi:DNA-binding MarR family transcriptional regulator